MAPPLLVARMEQPVPPCTVLQSPMAHPCSASTKSTAMAPAGACVDARSWPARVSTMSGLADDREIADAGAEPATGALVLVVDGLGPAGAELRDTGTALVFAAPEELRRAGAA